MFTPGQISGAFEKMENGDVALTLEILARVKRGGGKENGTRHPYTPFWLGKHTTGKGEDKTAITRA